MLTANQQKWVDALRSGEFEQGQEVLNRDDCYCCLGVACVLAERDGVQVERFDRGEIVGSNLDDQPKVQEWLGLAHEEGMYGPEHSRGYLSGDNDNGESFIEIADIIEAHAEELFAATSSAEGEQ